MTITKKTVADKIAAYLHHEMTLAQLVDWSERALVMVQRKCHFWVSELSD
jgi:hypothetical protein